MKNIKRFIYDKTAESHLSFTIMFYVMMITFVVAITILPIFSKQHDLDNFAKSLIRQAEIDGSVEQNELYSYLCNVYGITPKINWDYDSYDGKKVQLNRRIKVTLQDTYIFDMGSVLKSITVPLTAVAYGKSEVYWK